MDTDHKRGNIASSIMLLEYGDFECPYCGEAYWNLKKLIEDYGKDFCFVFRNFPLADIHPNAQNAAHAAEAAGNQNKFWQMHDLLYQHQSDLADTFLFQYAEELHLNTEEFRKDFVSSQVANKVQNDFMSGVRLGVNGTPTLFLNGVRLDNGYSYEALRNSLEEVISTNKYA